MSASNLFDDIEGDDDIFSTPVAKTPKRKKEWMDDLLDDESELFKSVDKDDVIKPEPVKEKGPGLRGKSGGGGLFDDFSLDEPEEPSASVNGHKDDEEFVVVSHDEVPSAEEAEKMASTVTPCEGQAANETDGQQSDELFNQNLSYEERARIRREQRRKKAEERARSQSNTPSPQPDTQEDTKRDQRSASPSPSPGIEDSSVESGKDASSAPQPMGHSEMVPGGNDKKQDTPSPSPEPDGAPEQDAAEQVWVLTKSLQRAQAENAQLQSDNDLLIEENKTLKDRVAELEKQLNGKNKEVEDLTTAHQKQVSDLEQQLKQKSKEIEDMKSTKKVEHKQESREHHKREQRGTPITMVSLKKTTNSPAGSPATKSKFRAGVDKGRPITSVADSVKKFGGAAPPGGSADVKKPHTVVTTKAKHSSPSHAKHEEKPPPAKKTVTTLPSKPPPSPKPSGRIAHHEKREHHAHPAKPHPPHGHADAHHHKAESPSKTVRVTTHKKPHPHHHHHHHHTHVDKKGAEHHIKKMEAEKKTEEATVSKEEPKAEPEAVVPPTEQVPPTEPKEEVSGESEEKKVEEKPTQSVTDETTIRELEKDTTRAKRVISLFENKASTTEEVPAWKVNAQQQREEKEKLEREKEAERQKEKEREDSAELEKSRTSSNASSSKDSEPVVNGNADAASAESAEKESESVDGAQLSKTRSQSSPLGTASKSTSALPNTNKNDEVIPRDNKMRKTVSSSNNNIIADPKNRLMAEEVKGKRSSWAAPKREECAVCGKVVYVMERLEADKVVYHKTCFKCTVCNKTLSTGTYAALQGKTYCKVHFKQLFKMKGNYDEGFGREQHKTKWLKKDQLDGESEA